MARTSSNVTGKPASAVKAWVSQIVKGLLLLAATAALVLIAFGAYLTHRIITTQNDTEVVSPATYLMTNYRSVKFTDPQGGVHKGWLLLGLRGAPAIVICPGYNSNRSELLWLGTVLQQNHFNVYLFNYTSPTTRETSASLGSNAVSDTLAAIQTVTKEDGVNPHRVGIYGVTSGAFGALAAAEQDSRVTTLVLDAPYSRPLQMFDAELDTILGGSSRIFRLLTHAEFRVATFGAKTPSVTQNLSKLAGRPKLFISPADVKLLSDASQSLYAMAPPPKRLLVVNHLSGSLTSDPEKREYESQVLNFFLQHLPLRAN